jgi:hypothetical protein
MGEQWCAVVEFDELIWTGRVRAPGATLFPKVGTNILPFAQKRSMGRTISQRGRSDSDAVLGAGGGVQSNQQKFFRRNMSRRRGRAIQATLYQRTSVPTEYE